MRINVFFSTFVALILVAGPALADDFTSQYNQTCGNSTTNVLNSQQQSYCKAADDAHKAAKTSQTLEMLHAGAAGVCTALCATSFFTTLDPAWNLPCDAASLGVGVADIIMTKNYMAATGVAMGGYSMYKDITAMTKTADVGKSTANAATGANGIKEGANAVDGATKGSDCMGLPFSCSCISAATEGLSTFMSANSASQDKQNAMSNLNSAKSVTSTFNGNSVAVGSDASQNAGTGGAAGAESGGSTPSNSGSATAHASGGTGNPCGSVNNLAGAVECAQAANQPNLAQLLANPNFPAAFQAASGMPFDSYLAKMQNPENGGGGGIKPSQAITGAMEGSLNTAAAPLVASNLDALAGEAAGADTMYAGGGHGGGGGGGDDIGNALKDVLGSFGGKKAEGAGPGVKEIKFGAAKRNLASVSAEDRTVSIFARVTYRYGLVSPRLFNQ